MRPSAQQALDRSDPTVRAFVTECGITERAVHLRLIGKSELDVLAQVERLQRIYGAFLQVSRPKRMTDSAVDWVSYGTILG